MTTESANTQIDQNGSTRMSSNAPIATSPAAMIPNQRPNEPPAQSENAATISNPPRISVIQPHAFRLLKTYAEPLTVTKFDSAIAAMPQMMFRHPLIASMIPAKIHQPVTLSSLP